MSTMVIVDPAQMKALPLGDRGIRRLVYVRFLIFQAKKFLENQTTETYYNLSVVMVANALELFLQVLSFCVTGKEKSKQYVSSLLDDLQNRLQTLPHAELEKVIRARNAVYHSAVFHTHSTCEEIVLASEKCLSDMARDFLKVDLDQVSLTNLLKNSKMVDALKTSEKYLISGNHNDAIIEACRAFASLETRLGDRAFEQLRGMQRGLEFGDTISWRSSHLKIPDPDTSIKKLAGEVEKKVNQKVMKVIHFVDFALMLGTDYEDYKYFERIKPLYHVLLNGEFAYKREDVEKRQYTKEDAEFIYGFVLKTFLAIEPKLKPVHVRTLDRTIVRTIE